MDIKTSSDTLIENMLAEIPAAQKTIKNNYSKLMDKIDSIRQLVNKRGFVSSPKISHEPLDNFFVVDGALISESTRGSSFAWTGAVALHNQAPNGIATQSSCLSILPHFVSLETVATGLMTMQEIMLSVKLVEDNPDSLCLVDGSRLSAIIKISSFYASITETENYLGMWKKAFEQDDSSQPGKLIHEFESRDWISDYLKNERIVAFPKLITTSDIIRDVAPCLLGHFDDKTVADLVLESGELLLFPFRGSKKVPVNRNYPFYKNVSALNESLTSKDHPFEISSAYFSPNENGRVFKIEYSKKLMNNNELFSKLLALVREETKDVNIDELYSFFVVDLKCKELVCMMQDVMSEVLRQSIPNDKKMFNLMKSYRTE